MFGKLTGTLLPPGPGWAAWLKRNQANPVLGVDPNARASGALCFSGFGRQSLASDTG